jgi:ABC-type protease/lipase transport system fused ATPase/permease subunit
VILNAVEWACHKFQRLTGRTNVWLAVQLTNLSVILYFVWAAMSFWNTDIMLRISVGLFCGALLYALIQTVFKVSIEEYENNAYRRTANGLRNPRRVRDALLRVSFLTLSIVWWYPVWFVYFNLHVRIVALSYLLVVLTTGLLYLLACDPLPPCTGWVRALFGKPTLSPSPASESAPAKYAGSISRRLGMRR